MLAQSGFPKRTEIRQYDDYRKYWLNIEMEQLAEEESFLYEKLNK